MTIDIKVDDKAVRAFECAVKELPFLLDEALKETATELLANIMADSKFSVTFDVEDPEALMRFLFSNEEDYLLWNLNQNLPPARLKGESNTHD